MSTDSKIAGILEEQRKQSADDGVKEENIPKSKYFGVWKGAVREHNDSYVDFQARDGSCTCFDYPDRQFVHYNADESSIDIGFNNDLITIYGRNLKSLYKLLMQRKVQWIKEVDDPKNETEDESDIFVEHISLVPGEMEEAEAS